MAILSIGHDDDLTEVTRKTEDHTEKTHAMPDNVGKTQGIGIGRILRTHHSCGVHRGGMTKSIIEQKQDLAMCERHETCRFSLVFFLSPSAVG